LVDRHKYNKFVAIFVRFLLTFNISDKNYISTSNKQIALTAGQTANAEVIIRQRRIIDFIIDPFKKLQQRDLKL
jgi:hypothetical protein